MGYLSGPPMISFVGDFHCDPDSEPPKMALVEDFYREPDNVQRGVTMHMGSDSLGVMLDAGKGHGSVHPKLPPSGTDEPYDFLKGKASNATDPSGLSDQPPQPSGILEKADLPELAPEPEKPEPETDALPGEAFSDGRVAPLELHSYGSERTTLIFQGPSPADLANCMYKFLLKELTADIIKLSLLKFSIKAMVFREDSGYHSNCTLKVRVWSAPPSDGQGKRLAVEFTRRRGDAVAFARTFQQAATALRARFGAAEVVKGEMVKSKTKFLDEVLWMPPPPPPAQLEMNP